MKISHGVVSSLLVHLRGIFVFLEIVQLPPAKAAHLLRGKQCRSAARGCCDLQPLGALRYHAYLASRCALPAGITVGQATIADFKNQRCSQYANLRYFRNTVAGQRIDSVKTSAAFTARALCGEQRAEENLAESASDIADLPLADAFVQVHVPAQFKGGCSGGRRCTVRKCRHRNSSGA